MADVRPNTPPLNYHPVFVWPTPEREDLLFYVEVNNKTKTGKNKKWAYGDAFWDAVTYPNHKLVYVTPENEQNIHRRYYASDRINQDSYNYEIDGSDRLVRSYLVKRSDYPTNFAHPTVGTADTAFDRYKFAYENISRAPKEMDALYIIVRRVYLHSPTTTVQYDADLERNVVITREVIPAGSETNPTSTNGTQIEVIPQNSFFDLKVTSEVVGWSDVLAGNGYVELKAAAGYVNYNFPEILTAVRLIGAWAYATSGTAASYSEDFFFEFDTTVPAAPPYSSRVRRFLTHNPDLVKAAFPLDKVRPSRYEFGFVKWWATTSPSTGAIAKKIGFPRPMIHGNITLPSAVNYVANNGETGSDNEGNSSRVSLPASSGWPGPSTASTWRVGFDTRETKLGLFLVSVVEIDMTGIY